MALTEDDVRHISKLAAIELSEPEVTKMKNELNDVFQYIEKLNSVVTRGVLPTSHVHGAVNYFRDDIIKDSLAEETLKEMAPEYQDGGYKVPRIIG